ncbi:glycosyltransferase [Myroides sp. WP-1]|uniref:glycosyltransferase n=1 Tax=Myroides sp. WP-1 TaxID=2759944 RepID=UPI0015FC6BB8|nr:glycosyltransferase [Myroides sp. WP-1]MBB1140541.1 glycosyltransferase [Myroides sp. WP-1]
MMTNIVFIAKTNLNNDGRILNQIKILNEVNYGKIKFDFILLPDKPVNISLDSNVEIHEINPLVRNSKILRPLIVLEFTFRALMKLIKLKPKVIHTQDFAVVLPVYIYKKFIRRKTILIYDDHEMPNENESFQYRILQRFERKLMKIADAVIYANSERQEILDKELGLSKSSYFLNLPYFEVVNDDSSKLSIDLQKKLNAIKLVKTEGGKVVIHQGALEEERGREKLAVLSSKLVGSQYRIVLLGISRQEFDAFLTQYQLSEDAFIFVGSVPYQSLDLFWQLGDIAVVMYLPTYINNRLCAPNRYFIALKNCIPTLVNKDNPVLFNFTNKYNSGFYIEDIEDVKKLDQVANHKYQSEVLSILKEEEINKFLSVYENFI